MTVTLAEAGVFSWSDWTAALSAQLAASDPAPDGSDYYHHWLAALRHLLEERGHADAANVAALTRAWQRAARATPHGQPVDLGNDPEATTRVPI